MQLKDVEGGNLMKHGFVTDSEGPQAVHAHKLGAKESNHCSPTPQNAESPSVLNVFRYLWYICVTQVLAAPPVKLRDRAKDG